MAAEPPDNSAVSITPGEARGLAYLTNWLGRSAEVEAFRDNDGVQVLVATVKVRIPISSRGGGRLVPTYYLLSPLGGVVRSPDGQRRGKEICPPDLPDD